MRKSNNKLKILIVEDSPTQARQLKYLLEKNGFSVTSAANGKEALSILLNYKPALIISDILMPEMDGFELSGNIRADERLKDIPVILLTSLSDPTDVIRGLECGADNFITKPYDEQYLISRIDYMLLSRELCKSDMTRMGIEIYFGGQKYNITSERRQILNLLLSTYETAVQKNNELIKTRDELKTLNEQLEEKVEERTAALMADITERRKAEEALKASEEKFRAISNTAADAILLMDNDGKISYWNPAAERMFGYTSKEAISNELHIFLAPERYHKSFKKGFSNFQTTGKGPSIGNTLIFEAIRKDGSEFPIEVSTSAILLGDKWCAVGIIRDITERKRAEETLKASKAKLHDNYFAQATINMILSESLKNIPLEEFLQKALNMILSIPWIAFEAMGSISLVGNDPAGLVLKAQINRLDPLKNLCAQVPFGKCLCGKAALTQEIQFADHIDERHEICYEGVLPHGHYVVPILFSGRTLGVLNVYLKEGHLRNQKEEDFLRNVADTLAGIIKRKQAEDRIEYLAYYDNLTGLPNRTLFIDRLTQGIARAEYSKKFVAVLILDIDRFKFINDSYGLDTGDAVLKAVANMLTLSVREGDTIARIGGDDFGILLIDIAQPEDIIIVVEKVMKNVSQTIHFGGQEIVLTLSGGISVHPQDGKDASALIKNADMALARAKQEGRKNYQFYTEGMDMKASEFVLMEKNLFNAIKNEEFILHYQPYWDINTKKILGMEALVRWQSPELGLVYPGKFIPMLEDTRMIIEVGEWVLREAIRQVKEWQDKKYPVVPVSVNLSLIQFRQKDISKMMEKIIRETGFYPSLLTLEITESAFMQDIEFTRSVLENLKNIGVSISIDDFGTGYSSLAHMKRFPIDNLKIDISFIREIAADPDTASIVMAIIAMAHTLNLKTIAEGIETEEQWKTLRLLRCDMGQGYYFSRPLPAEEAEKMFI